MQEAILCTITEEFELKSAHCTEKNSVRISLNLSDNENSPCIDKIIFINKCTCKWKIKEFEEFFNELKGLSVEKVIDKCKKQNYPPCFEEIVIGIEKLVTIAGYNKNIGE